MGRNTNLKRKRSTPTVNTGTKRTRRGQPVSSTDEAQLCADCQTINFDDIFRTKVKTCGKLLYRGKLVRPLEHVSQAVASSSSGKAKTCDLCQFFGTLAVVPDAARLELHAYSARAAFNIPRGLVADSVMLAVVPGKHNGIHQMQIKGPLHTALSGKMIMELDRSSDRIAGRQIAATINFDIVRSWLEFCDTHHTQLCGREDVGSIPGFSVIDCVARRIVSWSQLPKPADFVALSYVWGDSTQTCDGVTADGHLPDDTPRLIADAMETTIELGFRYIWIDRYCIPKDNAKDKHTQIQNMNLIYGSSIVTIIAAAGTDPSHGLPGSGSTPRSAQLSIRIGSCTLVATNHHAKEQVQGSRWIERAWTYQEGALSKRRLVFTDQLVYFQCCGMHCVETIAAPLVPLHTVDGQRMRDAVDMGRIWPLRGVGKYPLELAERITEYAPRSLTYPSDALHAFEGVLREFATMERSPVPNLCGIPLFKTEESDITASLVIGLSWWIKGPMRTRSPRPPHQWRRPGFPSWSWTGWNLAGASSPMGYLTFNLEQQPYYSNFKDKNTLKPVTALASFQIRFSDGTFLPWQHASDKIIAMAVSGNTPSELHVTGFAADVRFKSGSRIIWSKAVGGKNSFCADDRGLPCGVSFYYGPAISCWARALGMKARPAEDGAEGLFYDLRFLCLGYVQVTTCLEKSLVMVLRRREDADAYERLMLLAETIDEFEDILKDMQDGVAPKGWAKCETRIV